LPLGKAENEKARQIPLTEKIRSEIERARLADDILVVELPLQDKMTLRDAIYNAGGLTKDAYLEEAELYRMDPVTNKVTLHRINLRQALAGDAGANMTLRDRDRISVKSIFGFQFKQSVVIEGDVLHPGRYTYAENMTLRDLVFAAGNVKESAYLEEAEVASQFIEDGKIVKIAHGKVALRRALEGDQESNVRLKPYDLVTIKRLQDWRREAFITIAGEVKFPGRYIVFKGETLSSVVERAGGFTERAYLRGAVFTRDKVKELQKKTLDEMTMRLEKELASQSTANLGTAVSKEALEAMQAEAVQKKMFVDSLKKTEPGGRMAIYLMPMRLLKGSEFDIEIEDNDNLLIPRKNSVVNVMGSVMSMGSFVWLPDKDYKGYIELAGGYSQNADVSNTYIIKVDGTARKVRGALGWNLGKSEWELAGYGGTPGKLDPGDTIVVPEQLERIAWLREIKDITQILMNTAIIGGVVWQMFQ
jgi:polysaccharide biosynthesis/export protein